MKFKTFWDIDFVDVWGATVSPNVRKVRKHGHEISLRDIMSIGPRLLKNGLKKTVLQISRYAHAQSSFRVAHAQIKKITMDSGTIGACFYLSVVQLYDEN